MSETAKTVAYIGVAAAACLLAIVTFPQPPAIEVKENVGKPLFAEFTDPANAASLEVIELDEELAQLTTFEVAKLKASDLWVIPSHFDYPADAEERLLDAATLFVDLKVLDVASNLRDEHSTLGVMDPSESDQVEKQGAGKLVRIEDRNGEMLADLIIGREVPGQENLRFVRRPSQDAVYVIEIDPAKLLTRFEDWIDRDLLELNPFDVQSVDINDYSVIVQGQRGALDKRFELTCALDSASNKWSVQRFVTFNAGKPVEAQLLPDEELNEASLNELKNGLRDVEIVGVQRKPAGLGKDLKTSEELMNSAENMQSLSQKGFYPQQVGPESFELFAANGELAVTTKEGVRYLLRFGDIAGNERDDQEKLTRYMFVTASVDESKFPMPEKPNVPAGPAGPAAPEDAAPKADGQDEPPAATDSGSSCDQEPQEEPKQEEPKQEEPKQEEPKQEEPKQEEPKQEEPKQEEPKQEEPKQEEPKQEEPKQEEPKQEEPKQEAPEQDPAAAPAPPPTAPPQDDIAREAERERLLKEYQRQVEERDENLKKARIKVAQLNGRFADWYYVISEDVYKKLRLSRSQLIQEKVAERRRAA